jgi:hypothetical protein
MTQSALAAQLGITKGAVNHAVKKGLVILDASGEVNLHDPRTQKYMTRAPGKRRAAKHERKKKESPTPEPAVNLDALPAEAPPAAKKFVAVLKRAERPSDDDEELDNLDAAFLRVKIEEKTITNAARRGELIPRDIVAQFIQRIYSADTTELDQIADRLGGKLAGAARHATTEGEAASAVRSLLTEETARIKRHIHRIQKDFVKKYPDVTEEPELEAAQP